VLTADDVVAAARDLGFARAAIVPIEAPRRLALYDAWLDAGHAAGMTYLASPDHRGPRAELRALLAAAEALIVVALPYHRDAPVPADRLLRGAIARYARGEDYHLVLRDRLVALADALAARLDRPVASRPCVDSAPILEREWAERGGLGFIAKNTMLIAPGAGSYVVLGELLLDVALAPTAPATPPPPRCGACRACLDACPTGAFVDAYLLDAGRCISYLTIEHHGVIPRPLRAAIGGWVFGCDRCQEVCPWNAGAGAPGDPALAPRDLDHALPALAALATAGTNQLRRFVRRTALRRVPREVLLRNVAVALGNRGAEAPAEAVPALAALLGDRVALVRLHAAWALGALRQAAGLAASDLAAIDHLIDAAAAAELDDDVRAELAWARAA
jgi:epoxyqueuosine reductase